MANAQCWAPSRREFFEAQGAEPQAAAEALRRSPSSTSSNARFASAISRARTTAATADPQQTDGGRVLRRYQSQPAMNHMRSSKWPNTKKVTWGVSGDM